LSITGISRVVVLAALRAGGVKVSPSEDDKYTLEKEGVPIETLVLPDPVERRMLFRFKYKYGIAIHWFFNPDQIPKDPPG
jgi:hypothetical protein